jgi:hypothetical protein
VIAVSVSRAQCLVCPKIWRKEINSDLSARLLEEILSDDDTWVFQYDPETKAME